MVTTILRFILQAIFCFGGVALILVVASTVVRWVLIGVVHVTDPNPPHKYKLSYVDMHTGRIYTKTIKALTMQAAQDKAVEFLNDREWKKQSSYCVNKLERR